jgi:hypothetical protein
MSVGDYCAWRGLADRAECKRQAHLMACHGNYATTCGRYIARTGTEQYFDVAFSTLEQKSYKRLSFLKACSREILQTVSLRLRKRALSPRERGCRARLFPNPPPDP